MKINKKMQMSRNKRKASQALCEYFLILLVLAGLTILGVTTLLPKIKAAGGEYAKEQIDEIAGEVVLVEDVEFPSNLDGFIIYPNPAYPNHSDPGYRVANFAGLMKNVTIKIYTITGGLVLSVSPTLTEPKWKWNLKNSSGSTVASGTYLCKVSGGGYEKEKKLVVIK